MVEEEDDEEMPNLKKIRIVGYKKHQEFCMDFNSDLTIIVGENETGKTTILEAIEIVLNQKYFNYLSNSYEQQFTKDNIENFFRDPVHQNLPFIEIEIYLDFNDVSTDDSYFHGEHNYEKEGDYGIKFRYSFDDEFIPEFNSINFQETPILPLEFYKTEWKTFSGQPYRRQKNPIKSLLIDNSSYIRDIFGSYAKQVYDNEIELADKRKLSMAFKTSLREFENTSQEILDLDNFQISLDEKKTLISNLIEIQENGISIQNMGKGKENLIKTEIALEGKKNLVLVEEPENHLSHSNLKKLIELIKTKQIGSQIILTTHSPMVTSKLNLENVMWVNDEKATPLAGLDNETAKYFQKLDNINILQFILSSKVIIVEGASEYILLPLLYQLSQGSLLEEDGIEIISGEGITYKHYINLAKTLNKKILIITDNDREPSKIQESGTINEELKDEGYQIKVVMPTDIEEFTFEKSLYDKNESLLSTFARGNASEVYKGKKYPKSLAFMLNNKAESAFRISNDNKYNEKIECPDYIREGLSWLRNE